MKNERRSAESQLKDNKDKITMQIFEEFIVIISIAFKSKASKLGHQEIQATGNTRSCKGC